MRCRCKFLKCSAPANKTFALVPVRNGHFETLEAETKKFYQSRSPKLELQRRPFYMQIAQYVPWSKMNLKQGDWEDEIRRN